MLFVIMVLTCKSARMQTALSRRMNLEVAIEDACARALAAGPTAGPDGTAPAPDLALVWLSSAFAEQYHVSRRGSCCLLAFRAGMHVLLQGAQLAHAGFSLVCCDEKRQGKQQGLPGPCAM